MGRIYARLDRKKRKTYYIDFTVDGVRYRKKIGPSKTIALRALKEAPRNLEPVVAVEPQSQLAVEKFFELFDDYSVVNHASASRVRYRNILDNFRRFLREKRLNLTLSQLSPRLFEEYKIFRRKTPLNKGILAKTNTVNMELKSLRSILNLAVKWGYLTNNPTTGIKKLKVVDAKKPRFLSSEEIKLLLDKCGRELYPIFHLMLNTGMRLGEVVNLTWNDVSFERQTIFIQAKESWHPKTGERIIPMTAGVILVLASHKKAQGSNPKFVFAGKDGGPLSIKLRERFKTVTKRCGFPDVTKIHTLRHTFASHLVMRGVDLPTVQKLMGHADIQTTMIYSHLSARHLVDAVNKLELDE